ncbi:MAG TPA: cellulose synthase complex periplasmic endoglucanase BcsZ [Thiobacillus sp.]
MLAAWTLFFLIPAAAGQGCQQWQTDWAAFKSAYLEPDGRVIANDKLQSHSEGQAYSLFFALVANDPVRFETILNWTNSHLAHGKLSHRLPAWLWGKREDGSWGVLDDNSASDADILLAYTLGEASRLWSRPDYRVLANAVAQHILRDETTSLPGLGLLVLPGKVGFSGPPWKLNPSYYPTIVLRRMATLHTPEWKKIVQTAYRLLAQAAPNGVEPDWLYYDKRGVYGRTKGSYDAIRTYLWAGMDKSIEGDELVVQLAPFLRIASTLGHVPESVDPLSLHAEGKGSSGFDASITTIQKRQGHDVVHPVSGNTGYYTQSLSLFGTGYMIAFDMGPTGELIPFWVTKPSCARG